MEWVEVQRYCAQSTRPREICCGVDTRLAHAESVREGRARQSLQRCAPRPWALCESEERGVRLGRKVERRVCQVRMHLKVARPD
eukprot:2531124-Pleurochrysis_carterae.AAC.1